jgi:flagellar motility protein MotE (MotC chaperone)
MGGETHRYGKLQWLFYIVILPLLFTALLSGIILQFLGFDITGKITSAAKHLPGVHYLFPEDPKTATADGSKPAASEPAVQDKIKSAESANKQLQDDLNKKNSEIDQLKQQVDNYKKKASADASGTQANASTPNASTPNANDPTASTVPAKPDPIKQQAQVYAAMSASKAAAILNQLSATEVRRVLDKMTKDQQAAILEKMDPTKAALIMK